MNKTHALSRPRGFTLVELLVVMTIIGILMAILVPAIYYARIAALNAAIVMEMSQLSGGLDEYKNAFGDFPPNFDNQQLLNRHLAKRQRISQPQITALQGFVYAPNTSVPTGKLDPSEALVFWLGGQSTNGGLRNNPVAPFQPPAGSGEPKAFFDFVQTRLVDTDNDGWLEYVAPSSSGGPYVYFENRSYANHTGSNMLTVPNRGKVGPMLATSPANSFQEPTRFQIITTGLDGMFGDGTNTTSTFPAGPFQDNDKDNISNFSNGRTFQDSVP